MAPSVCIGAGHPLPRRSRRPMSKHQTSANPVRRLAALRRGRAAGLAGEPVAPTGCCSCRAVRCVQYRPAPATAIRSSSLRQNRARLTRARPAPPSRLARSIPGGWARTRTGRTAARPPSLVAAAGCRTGNHGTVRYRLSAFSAQRGEGPQRVSRRLPPTAGRPACPRSGCRRRRCGGRRRRPGRRGSRRPRTRPGRGGEREGGERGIGLGADVGLDAEVA